MSTLYGVIDDLEFSMLPAVLNIDSTGTLPGVTDGKVNLGHLGKNWIVRPLALSSNAILSIILIILEAESFKLRRLAGLTAHVFAGLAD